MSGRDWMEDRIDRLEYDLSCIAKMKPYAAINYIRHAVGYEGIFERICTVSQDQAGRAV